jgi:PglZ domain
MGIETFIRDTILSPRLQNAECLVVYDPEQRYRQLCLQMTTDTIAVVDATESSLESREAAQQAFRQLSNRTLHGLLIYIPTPAPLTDEQKQRDPFSIYAECGAQFPSPADSDEYQNLCLKAKPECSTELRQIFKDDPAPTFAVIDAVGGGLNFPQLRATLKAESSIDILTALLAPTDSQQQALKASARWIPELKEFLKITIGLLLNPRVRTWAPIADELWRFVLFSEFVFDLPDTLPAPLQGVPHATHQADITINEVCDRLRNDQRLQSQYIEKAEAIEAEMNLLAICHEIDDLGNRDTFPFEERTFLKRAIQGLLQDDLDTPRKLLTQHERSIWRGKGENQEQWLLLQSALSLISVCEDFDRQLLDHSRSQETLIDFYISSLREVDRRQREFEESVSNATASRDLLDPVITASRSRYRQLTEKVQTLFTRHLEKSSWAPSSKLSNSAVFDRFIAPRLSDKGYRMAYLMIDALRYELGVELEKLLTDLGTVQLHPACAQLPTITPVGMASLLPGAENGLTLEYEKDTLVPKLNGTPVTNVSQRMDILRKRYGDRFTEMLLKDFIHKKTKIDATVDLLVLRSTEIDQQLESDPENTLSLIPKTLKLIRAALTKLSQLGFSEAIVVTDHGFFLNAQAEAGDVCRKPNGNWLYNAHDRLLLGSGTADPHNLILATDKLGIRGSFSHAALPYTMAPYRAGHLYFHGGASLAEAIVPVLLIRFKPSKDQSFEQFQVELTYKNGAKRITTRLPIVDVSLSLGNLFAQHLSVEILLEAQDSKGNVVGEPHYGNDVNPATHTITLAPNERKQIIIRMHPDFEGKFAIKALNPKTLTAYSSLSLETDYTV